MIVFFYVVFVFLFQPFYEFLIKQKYQKGGGGGGMGQWGVVWGAGGGDEEASSTPPHSSYLFMLFIQNIDGQTTRTTHLLAARRLADQAGVRGSPALLKKYVQYVCMNVCTSVGSSAHTTDSAL